MRADVNRLLIVCLGVVALATALTVVDVAGALELGKPAPDFTLPGTNGENISLKQFRNQKLVLLEFFGAAFAPT